MIPCATRNRQRWIIAHLDNRHYRPIERCTTNLSSLVVSNNWSVIRETITTSSLFQESLPGIFAIVLAITEQSIASTNRGRQCLSCGSRVAARHANKETALLLFAAGSRDALVIRPQS